LAAAELREFKVEAQAFRHEMQAFKDEMREDRREMNRKWGDLANKLGTMVGDLVCPSLLRVMPETVGQEPDRVAIRVKQRGPDGRRREIGSLLEYVLVAQDRRQIDIYRRTGGDWAHERVQGGTFRIETLDLEVPVEAVYEDIDPELPAA